MPMELPRRKSPRIPSYDYSTPNYYFVTICTHEKRCIFGEPGNLNAYGRIARDNLIQITTHNPFVQVDKFVVMPNHVHAILIVSPETQISNGKHITFVLGQYKMSVTKMIRKTEPEMRVWQRSFHDHIIRNQKSYEKIWMYIEDNPRKWEEDCFYMKQKV
jgi:REP element-mobilizing transposase RayT